MKKTLLVLVLTVLGLTAMAKPVDPASAQRVAANFWNSHRDNGVAAVTSPMQQVAIPFDGMYLFKAGEKGFVFVAADDCVQPILGYSFHSPAGDRLNREVRYWLSLYQEQIDWMRSHDIEASDETAAMWRAYASAPHGEPEPLTAVSPLLTTTWDQSPYYNNLCPYDATAGSRAVTGCVATATAQVMKYWNHPTQGTGSHSYVEDDYGTLSANFAATTYQWSQMPNALTSTSTTAQVNAVATLMYHIGVAIEMDYSVSGSGAYTNNYGSPTLPCAQNALSQYFGYQLVNCYTRDASGVTDAIWAGYINTELNASRPVIYAGQDTSGGHCFVCDGYNTSNMYHFNWGWGGWQDGYYSLSNLAPGSGGTGGNATYTFNLSQRILTGVQPDTGYTPYDPFAPYANCLITSFPYTENFDDTSHYSCLHIYDANADGTTWGLSDTAGVGSSYAAAIWYADNSDDYLILPSVITPGSYTITWKAKAKSSSWPETYQVYAGSTNMIFSETLSSTSYVTRTANFTVTSGDTVTPMFRYISDDEYALFIDDITISVTTGPTPPTSNDTISWCDTASYVSSIGTGTPGSMYWGISLTPTQLTGHNYLRSVMLYVSSAGSYTLNVSTGGTTAPGTLAHTQNVTFTSSQLGWQEILLDATFQITQTQNLWITFNSSDVAYPAAGCNYVGNTNSDWASVDGTTWGHLQELSSTLTYSWMIKAVTSQTSGPLPAPTVHISGPTSTQTGVAQTFTATASSGATVTWTLTGATPSTATGLTATATWNTPGTYNVIATATSSTGTGRDTLQITVISCSAITTFPYVMNFEGASLAQLPCWTVLDVDGDGYSWTTTMRDSVIGSASYINNVGALTPDNWLISPQMVFTAGNSYTLSWTTSAIDATYYAEHYGVYVSTSGTATSNFTLVQDYTMTTPNVTQMTLDLSGYAGQTVYIAFRHWNVTDVYWMLLDDITVTQTSGPAPQYTITVQSANPTMGSVSGGGTYTAGSNVTISATANSGYHFTQWNDGNTNASRTITVTGNATYIASFAANSTPGSSDTISWCDTASYASTIGAGGALYWGISLTPTQLSGHNYLRSVMLYVAYAGSYTLRVHTGGTTAPGTLAHTQTATFTESQLGWQEILLDATFPINATQNLWITFYNTGIQYPAAACAYVGNTNSDWASVDDAAWDHLQNLSASLTYSWLIKAVTSQNAGPLPAPTISIDGPAYTATGVAQTFTATATSGATVTWMLNGATPASATGLTATATWNTPGTYNVIATAANTGGSSSDTLVVNVTSCGTVTTFPYTLTFEPSDINQLACWTILDADGDGYSWNTSPINNVTGSIGSASYINNVGALTPDNWLISPQMQFTSGSTYTLSWKTWAIDQNYYAEHYGIYVSTTGTATSNFTLVQDYTMTTADTTAMTLDLSTYAGQTIYIAFRHWNVTDEYWMMIDDIALTQTAIPGQNYTITVQSANPTMGSVSGGGTFAAGTTTTISATANSGYHFTQWNDGNTNATRSITVTGNATYIANFESDAPTQYTITVQSANPTMGTVSGGGIYNEGTAVTISAIPFDGYHFTQWNDGNTDATRTITVNGNATYIANFEANPPQQYTITVLSANEQMGYVSGGGTFTAGTTITISATPYSGYYFEQWNDGNTNATRTVVVTGNATYIATFTATNGIDGVNSDSWSLYPNPATTAVTISGVEQATVTVNDITGRVIATHNVANGNNSIDVSRLAAGTYFVRITSNGTSAVRKLIIK